MEENVERPRPISVAWSDLLIYSFYGLMVYFHATTQSDTILTVLSLVVGLLVGHRVYSYYKTISLRYSMAVRVLLGDNYHINLVRMLNPFNMVNVADSIVYLLIAIYFLGLGEYIIAVLAITPCILMAFAYNSVLRTMMNPSVQSYASEEIEYFEKEEKRNAIFNEELNKVMAEVVEKSIARWKEAGVYTENDENERNERGESDQAAISTPDENDRPG